MIFPKTKSPACQPGRTAEAIHIKPILGDLLTKIKAHEPLVFPEDANPLRHDLNGDSDLPRRHFVEKLKASHSPAQALQEVLR